MIHFKDFIFENTSCHFTISIENTGKFKNLKLYFEMSRDFSKFITSKIFGYTVQFFVQPIIFCTSQINRGAPIIGSVMGNAEYQQVLSLSVSNWKY